MKEELRLKYLKMYEDFNKKGIPDEIKYMITNIRKDLLNNIFNKSYSFGSYCFNVSVNFTKGTIISYNSRVNIMSIFEDPDNPVDIPIDVVDESINIDYLLSVITHEVRHIYDIYSIKNEYELIDFYNESGLVVFKNTPYYKFSFLVYLALEHELIARNNMLYARFRWLNITDKSVLTTKFKELYVYESLEYLNKFNSISFVNSMDLDLLLKYTNKFIKNMNKTNFCKDKNDLLEYYEKWAQFFKSKYIEYYDHALTEIDNIINDITNDIVYEKKQYSYTELNINGSFKIFNSFYKSIFNK